MSESDHHHRLAPWLLRRVVAPVVAVATLATPSGAFLAGDAAPATPVTHGPEITQVVSAPRATQAAGSQIQSQLAATIGDFNGASAAVVHATDRAGISLDVLRVINGATAGNYLGVYHHQAVDGSFSMRLATSTDLTHWSTSVVLANNATNPFLTRLTDGSYLLAFEKVAGGHSEVSLAHYANLQSLLQAKVDRTVDLPRTLSSLNEGTPTIESVNLAAGASATSSSGTDLNNSTMTIRFHYNHDGRRDLEAVGVLTGFTAWTAHADPALDGAVTSLGAAGSLGDRSEITVAGHTFTLIEGERTAHDLQSYGAYLVDNATGTAVPVPLRSPWGVSAVGNNHVSIVSGPHGQQEMVTTMFGFAPNGAGELIGVHPLPAVPARTPSGTPGAVVSSVAQHRSEAKGPLRSGPHRTDQLGSGQNGPGHGHHVG